MIVLCFTVNFGVGSDGCESVNNLTGSVTISRTGIVLAGKATDSHLVRPDHRLQGHVLTTFTKFTTAKMLQHMHTFVTCMPDPTGTSNKSPTSYGVQPSSLVTAYTKRDWGQMPRLHVGTFRTESEQRIHPEQNRETTTDSMLTRSHNLAT